MATLRILRLSFLCATGLCATGALAQVAAVPYGGYALGKGPLIGVGLEVPFSGVGPVTLSVQPTADYVFLDALDTAVYDATTSGFVLGTDVRVRFGAAGLRPFAGAGLALYYVATSFTCGDAACDAFQGSFEGADDGLWLGPSVAAGVLLPDLSVEETRLGAPFAQLRLVLVGELLLSASVGFAVFL